MDDGGSREKGRVRRGHGRGGREEGRGEEDMERKRGVQEGVVFQVALEFH